MCSLPFFLLLLTSLLITISPSASTLNHAKNQHNPPSSHNPVQPTTNIPPSELETLFKIMETMSSDTNWRVSYPNPCTPGSSWLGIECKVGNDNHLHVTRLDFGTYPNPMCKKTATFPSEIFNLPYLQSVFFYQCFTHTSTTITIPLFSPSSIPSPIEQLSFRSNPTLIGKIPSQISTLKSMQVLTMSQNRLNGEIPPGIFTLNSLLHLDLSYNALTGSIPAQVGSLGNLQNLDFSYNSLSGTIPTSIGELGSLQKLDLSSNLLVGKIPNTIQNLISLNFLALSNNKLKGSFPDGLNKLVNLQYFIMENNPMFTTIPTQFGTLLKLQELRLANSGFSGTIPPTLSQLQNLSTLSLQNNRLTGEIPSGFTSLNHIYHLNLSRNFLQGVVPFNASFMRRLGRNLDMSENPGLCLDPKEAIELKSESNLFACGNHKSYSFTQPNRKSHASSLINPFFSLAILLLVIVLHYSCIFYVSY